MTLDELVMEQRLNEIHERDYARIALRRQALSERRSILRSSAASALVRVGLWLDRAASERMIVPAHQASQ